MSTKEKLNDHGNLYYIEALLKEKKKKKASDLRISKDM